MPVALLRTTLLAGLAVFTLLPLLVVAGTSLKTLGEVFQSPATLIPRAFVWHNYVDIFVRIPMARHLLNSLFIALAAVFFNIMVATPAAYAMARIQFRGRGLFGMSILVVQMFSPVIVLIPLFELMKALRLLDTYTALILVNTAITLPFSIWMLRGFFKNIPEELEDAAMIDGLSRTGMIFRIALPLTAPGLTTTAIFTFVSAWNEFIFALVLVSKRTHAADYHGALRLGKKQRGGVELFDGHRGGGDSTHDVAVSAGEEAVDGWFDGGCG